MLSPNELYFLGLWSDTFKIYKKLGPLTQERSHCIRKWLSLIFKKCFFDDGSHCI